MPTPLEIFLDPISLVIIGMYLLLYVWETVFPRNKNLPKIPYSTLRGVGALVTFFLLSTYLPLLTDEYLAQFQLMDLSYLSVGFQVLIGLVVYEFMLYVWHRTMHSSDTLWKSFHQMHHSSEKMDTPSAYYLSPLDMIGFTLLGSLVFALIVGLSPSAITAVILSLNFLSIFQHANIKTPTWMGYIIQRPEQHALHHERGVHKYNYSDFPVFDMIFGTFKNPKDHQGQYGFYDGGSARIMDMIMFKDLNRK